MIISELGNRSNQEDAVYPIQGKSSVSDRLFILCDGMGGHDDGEVASQLVCKTLSTYIIKHLKEGVLTDTILNDAIGETFDKINRYENDSLKKMGTTLTLLCLHQGGATMAHIGDSRIYHIRPSEHRILYKSRDHSLAYDLYLAGEISLDEVDNYKKNVITRAIMPGLNRRPKTDIVHTTDLQKDDYFLLCSDGLLEQMSDDELLAILCSNDSNDKKRNILIDKTSGNKDNHSAIVVQLSDIVKDSHQDSYLHDEHINKSNAILLEQGQNKEDIHPQLDKKKSKIFKLVLDMFKKLFLFIFFLSLPLSLMAQAAGGEVIRHSKTVNTTDKKVVVKIPTKPVLKQPILKVTCPTNGAIIYINKKEMGPVPWSGELSPGNYTVEARLKDYYSSQKTVKLKNNDNKTISIDALKPMTGTSLNASQKGKGLTSCPDTNHPHWIDLGLPSGTQWRCCNEGASTPEAYGGYYTFRQVSSAPTMEQCKELVSRCKCNWKTQNGVNGRKFTGPNGGTIFLPAAGSGWYGELDLVGSYGNYWSSTPSGKYGACGLLFGSGDVYFDYWGSRYYGLSVRPVRKN